LAWESAIKFPVLTFTSKTKNKKQIITRILLILSSQRPLRGSDRLPGERNGLAFINRKVLLKPRKKDLKGHFIKQRGEG
jgi:hypothetical protein